jgi:hypothetical protein
MPSIPIMPFVILVLFLLPIKLAPQQLKRLAFAIWLAGGVVLCMMGLTRLMQAPDNAPVIMAVTLLASIAIGIAKGKFVLGKTAARNLDRLNTLVTPQKPINVYSVRSWVMIGLMIGISILLNLGGVPLLWRGAINMGIGMALIVSSFVYVAPPKSVAAPKLPSTSV